MNSLFSPISDWELFKDLDTDAAKLRSVQVMIKNFTAFLDHLIGLTVPEQERISINLELDKSTKLTIDNGSDYRITTTHNWLTFSEIVFRRTANQITALSYKDKDGLKHNLLKDSKPIDIKPVTDLFESTELSSVKDQSAFFFDKARRLLEMQANPKLAAHIAPMFFVNPEQIWDRELFEQRLAELNHQGPIIVRSAHLLEGSAELALSGIFSSIPGVEASHKDFLAAVDSIKQDDLRLQRVNIGKEDWQKINTDDLGLIVMPDLKPQYYIKIEPVIYNSDRESIVARPYSTNPQSNLLSNKPLTKADTQGKQVDFEIKIFATTDSGPGDLVYRSDLANLKPQSIISQEQINQIKSIYQELSSQYSQEFQEAELLIANDKVSLVQTRDQAAIEKHPDDDFSGKLIRFSLYQSDVTDESLNLIPNLFSDDPLPMIVIDEDQAWYRFLDDNKPTDLQYNKVAESRFLLDYKQRIKELAGSLGRYQLFIKNIGLTNGTKDDNSPAMGGDLGFVTAYEDIADLAEISFANDMHVLRSGSRFHNLLFTNKSRHATVQLPRSLDAFHWVYPDDRTGYNPRTGLLQNPGSPRDIVQHLMYLVKHEGNAHLDIDINEQAI